MKLRDLILAKDWEAVAVRVAERYGVALDPADLAQVGDRALDRVRGRQLSEGFFCLGPRGQESTWWMWLTNRVEELGSTPPVGRQLSDFDTTASAVLHVFFLHLEETDEMLARLRRQDRTEKAGPARSKISKASVLIHPIDRVAGRVGPGPQ